MASLKDRILEAAVKVARAKEALEQAQKEYDELFKQATKKQSKNQAEDSDGIKESIMAFLSDKTEGTDFNEIASSLKEKATTVRALLYELKADGKVEKIGRGVWKRTDVSPGLSLQ